MVIVTVSFNASDPSKNQNSWETCEDTIGYKLNSKIPNSERLFFPASQELNTPGSIYNFTQNEISTTARFHRLRLIKEMLNFILILEQ
jgi:hypothetical protein